jgi:hypothetical protein
MAVLYRPSVAAFAYSRFAPGLIFKPDWCLGLMSRHNRRRH